MSTEKIGHITIGYGTKEQRDIELTNRMTFQFHEHRLVTIGQLEGDNGFSMTVENPESSGRATQSNMWLSEPSFKALFHSVAIYYASKNWDLQAEIKEIVGGNNLRYWVDGDIECIFDKEQEKSSEE